MAAPLAGRRALVTGAARGIGAAIVRRLASDGAAVAFTYSSSADAAEKLVAEVTETGGTAFAIQADSGDPVQVARAIDETVTQLGGLDILVNNAGILPAAPIETLTGLLPDMARSLHTNVAVPPACSSARRSTPPVTPPTSPSRSSSPSSRGPSPPAASSAGYSSPVWGQGRSRGPRWRCWLSAPRP